MAMTPLERKRRQLSTAAGRAKHAAVQRRYRASGGRHQESIYKANKAIERYTRELEALTNGCS